MKPGWAILLVISILGNLAAIAFICVLIFTPLLDLPLAAYSHQKNCEKDFQEVLKLVDKIPREQREPAKQMFATLVCQKDYKTGQPLTPESFNSLFNKLETSQ